MALFAGITLPERPDLHNIQRLDIMQLPMLRRMTRNGLRWDLEAGRALESQLSSDLVIKRRLIVDQIPPESLDRFLDLSDFDDDSDEPYDDATIGGFSVESPAKMAELLYDVFGLHLGKVTIKKTKTGDRLSTGKKTLEQLKREHPIVPLILEYREIAKLLGTYVRAMPRQAKWHPKGKDCPLCGRHHWTDEWRVHQQIMTTRTGSGRTASKNPNLANIPARSKLGRLIRACFIASEGHLIAQRDYSQIELRLLADRSGDQTMIDVYVADGDIHLKTAMGTFNITDPSKVDKLLHRAPSKNTNFAVAYLITAPGLLDLMASTFATAGTPLPEWMTEQWCDEFIKKWFALYPGIRSYLDDEESKIRRYGIAWTACGRVRRIPEVHSSLPYVQEAGVRQGSNHGIQGFSADIMKLAMAELDYEQLIIERDYGIEVFPLSTVYDELLQEVAEDDAEFVCLNMGDVMERALIDRQTGRLMCKVPIKSEGSTMRTWSKD